MMVDVKPVDKHAGQKLRFFRIRKGLSQTALGEAVDVTFQQIQKYEKGVNRISASKLHEFARILGISVGDFFEGSTVGVFSAGGDVEDMKLLELLSTHEGRTLNRAFASIQDAKVRKSLLDLITALSHRN